MQLGQTFPNPTPIWPQFCPIQIDQMHKWVEYGSKIRQDKIYGSDMDHAKINLTCIQPDLSDPSLICILLLLTRPEPNTIRKPNHYMVI